MLENLEEMTAQGTLKFLRIKSNLPLLVRNETLFRNPLLKKSQYVLWHKNDKEYDQ